MKPTVLPSLRALLVGSVDYAGLFPPAGLALGPALENHAAYTRGNDAWMLGCFVLPTAKLREAGPLLDGQFDPFHPLRVSALGSKSDSAEGSLANLRASLQELADIPQADREALAIEQFEMPLPSEVGLTPKLGKLLWDAAELIGASLPSRVRIFWEVPFSAGLAEALRGVADHNAKVATDLPRFRPDGRMLHYSPAARPTHRQSFCLKLRTGGTEGTAFPTCEQLACALVAARDAAVTLKFTAGLHHPLRHFNEALNTRMHGFLNVFAAGILAREHRLDEAETQAILEDERPESFRFDADGFTWCDRRVSTAALAAHREFITSFGSCSFDEPRDDLRRLSLLA